MNVLCNGCFDGLHRGHLEFLRRAAEYGPLTVLLNSDISVRRIKGPMRPMLTQDVRASALMACGYVKQVEIFHDMNPCHLIRERKPDVLVRSLEYAETDFDVYAFIKSYGGTVVFLPRTEGISTSENSRNL